MVADGVQFEAAKPAHRRFAAGRETREDTMLADALVMADLQRCAIDEGDTRVVTLTKIQIHEQEVRQHATSASQNVHTH